MLGVEILAPNLINDGGKVVTAKSIETLNNALGAARANLNRDYLVRVVMGNEASDLDSMASSIAYGYLLSQDSLPGGEIVLPVMNIPRDDFKLRTEAVYLFKEVGIDISRLVFLDEINLGALRDRKLIKLVLIDHNKLAKSQEPLADAVDEIIDHHVAENLYPYVTKRAICPGLGSTATLIAERIINRKRELLDEGLATLLLGTILLDTANLSPNRTKSKDEEMVKYLSDVVVVSRDTLFEKVNSEKFNASGLSTYDLLRKDYKEGDAGRVKYGISSVPISVRDWFGKDPNLGEGFLGYADAKKVDLLLTMHFYEDPEFRRELGIFSKNQALREKTTSALTNTDLQLEPMAPSAQPGGKDTQVFFFKQLNTKIARKNLQPILDDIFINDRPLS